MRISLYLRMTHLMGLGVFVIAWWGCAARPSLVGNPAFDGVYEGNPLADAQNRAYRCPLSGHQVVNVRNGEVTLATSNDTKMGVVQADGKLVMTGAPLMKIQGFHAHVDGTFTHNALDAVVFFPAWTALGGGGPCKFSWHFTKTR
jgi:hypothetical protein